MSDKKTTLLIYNPRAGRSLARPKPRAILAALGKDATKTYVAVTAYRGHAREIVAHEWRRYRTIVCCGGDGTLNEVVSALPLDGTGPDIAYIPTGSTNDMANSVGIPDDLEGAAELIKKGVVHGYDVGSFNERVFNYIASFGPGVSVSYSTPQRVKNVLGYGAYMINGFGLQVIPTLRALKPKHIIIEHDGQTLEDDFYFGTVTNSLSAAGLFKFGDEVKFDDGLFEVVLIRRIKSPMQTFSLIKKMHDHDYDGETLVHFKAAHLKLSFPRPEIWTLDGESSGEVSEVEITVRNKAVRIFSPDGEHFLEKGVPAVRPRVSRTSAAKEDIR